ncbi:hypothetical protein UlMin_035787 [Ulmus minor]
MEIDKLGIEEDPHLSGAYIRSLVKQLSSSKTKDSMKPEGVVDGESLSSQNSTNFGEGLGETQDTQQTQQPQKHKKQVRRRLHTTRPYQERLLNMAEARREIVTALKFHRATMKQASEQQQQQQQQQQQEQPQPVRPSQLPCFELEGKIKSRRNHRIYPSNTENYSNYLENMSYSNFSYQPPPPTPFSWPVSPICTLPIDENLNFPLPNQTLGLNLNFQDFNNIDTSLFHNSNSPSFYSTSASTSSSSSSPASSSSPCVSVPTDQEIPSSAAISQMEVELPAAADVIDCSATTSSGGGMHAAMDDEEMAEIRSIGEQHQMEWNDTMNLVTSAWWFKFLKGMELGCPDVNSEDYDVFHPFDDAMKFPAWLNPNESCFKQHFDDYCLDDYFQAPALPSMEIGEIEGMDGEWLA